MNKVILDNIAKLKKKKKDWKPPKGTYIGFNLINPGEK